MRALFDGLPHSPDVQELEQRLVQHEADLRLWVTNPSSVDRVTLKAQLGELTLAIAAARRRHGQKTMPPPPVSVTLPTAPPPPVEDKK